MVSMEVSWNRGTPLGGWLTIENPTNMEDLGLPNFRKTPSISGIYGISICVDCSKPQEGAIKGANLGYEFIPNIFPTNIPYEHLWTMGSWLELLRASQPQKSLSMGCHPPEWVDDELGDLSNFWQGGLTIYTMGTSVDVTDKWCC